MAATVSASILYRRSRILSASRSFRRVIGIRAHIVCERDPVGDTVQYPPLDIQIGEIVVGDDKGGSAHTTSLEPSVRSSDTRSQSSSTPSAGALGDPDGLILEDRSIAGDPFAHDELDRSKDPEPRGWTLKGRSSPWPDRGPVSKKSDPKGFGLTWLEVYGATRGIA